MNAIPFDRSVLSAREDQILSHAIEGLTDVQIAQQMAISQSTVNSYWVRIRGKLGQLSRTEMVALALKEKARQEMSAMQETVGRLRAEARQQAKMETDYAHVEIYRAALDALPEAMLIACEKGLIRYANPRLEAMFGYEEGELVGEGVEILVPANVRERERSRMDEYLQNPHPLRLGLGSVVHGRRRNGSVFRVVLLLDSRLTSVGHVVSCVVRDFVSEIDARREFVSTWSSTAAAI